MRVLTHDEAVGPPLTFEDTRLHPHPRHRRGRGGARGLRQRRYHVPDSGAWGPFTSPIPGSPVSQGNCVISGHRTTKTRPFNRLDELKAGDVISIDNPRGHYEYTVYSVYTIDPAEDVTLPTDESIITLTTCHPEGNATQRLVVRGALSSFTPIEYMP